MACVYVTPHSSPIKLVCPGAPNPIRVRQLLVPLSDIQVHVTPPSSPNPSMCPDAPTLDRVVRKHTGTKFLRSATPPTVPNKNSSSPNFNRTICEPIIPRKLF